MSTDDDPEPSQPDQLLEKGRLELSFGIISVRLHIQLLLNSSISAAAAEA